jgi:plasmid maintenance system killer protein
VDIIFESQKFRKECNEVKLLIRKVGPEMAKRIIQRLDELRAADKLADISHLPPPRLHELIGNRKGQFSIDLKQPYRLLFVPANDPIPLKPDGGVDLTKVTIVRILGVEDTHE